MKNSHKPSPSVGMALLAAVAIPIGAANADTTFVIDGTEGVTSYSLTADGITLLLTNPNENGGVFAFGNSSGASHGDLDLSNPLFAFVGGFNFTFDADVRIVSFNVSRNTSESAGSFTLSGPDSPDSTGNPLGTTGEIPVNEPFQINAGHVGTLTTAMSNSETASLHSITVASVPEPGSASLLAFCGLAALAKRRRRNVAAK